MAGIIPGADFIPDLVGMTYATLRGDVNKAGEYVLGVAMVGVSTGILVLGSKMIGETVNTIAHRGRQLSINASNRLESILLPGYRPQIASIEIFKLDFSRQMVISLRFIFFVIYGRQINKAIPYSTIYDK